MNSINLLILENQNIIDKIVYGLLENIRYGVQGVSLKKVCLVNNQETRILKFDTKIVLLYTTITTL